MVFTLPATAQAAMAIFPFLQYLTEAFCNILLSMGSCLAFNMCCTHVRGCHVFSTGAFYDLMAVYVVRFKL